MFYGNTYKKMHYFIKISSVRIKSQKFGKGNLANEDSNKTKHSPFPAAFPFSSSYKNTDQVLEERVV